MTENKTIVLPDDPNEFKAIVARILKNQQERKPLLLLAEKAKQEILASLPKQKTKQLIFSFLPVEMTRVSPFFPMPRRTKNVDRPYTSVDIKNSWGSIVVEGPRLSIYDEDIMLALLYIAKQQRKNVFITTIHELCKIIGITPAKSTYTSISKSLGYLQSSKWTLNTKTLKIMVHPLGPVGIDETNRRFLVELHEIFLRLYANGLVSSIDLTLRRELKGDLTKALYRFFRGQSGTYHHFRLDTIARAINMTIDDSTATVNKEQRRQIKNSLAELKRKNFLEKWCIKDDIAHAEIKKKQKRLAAK